MRKLQLALLASAALFLASPAQAQYYQCGLNQVCALSSIIVTNTCCTISSDDSYAAMVASWAVSLQLRGWLSKDEDKLTREDVKDRQEKLKVLCDWIKTVENHVYAQAYTQWAQSMAIKLNSASNRLDHNEIASALLLHGLPALPDGAK